MTLTRQQNFIWLITAIGTGVIVATQSLVVTTGTLVLMAFSVLYGITPYSAFIVLAVLAPLHALVNTEASLPLPLGIGEISVIALVAIWIVHKIRRRQDLIYTLSWSVVYIPLIGFVTVTGVTAFNAFALGFWLSEWLKWVLALTLVIIILDLIRDHTWEWLIFGVIIAGVANALVGMYIFLGGSGADHLLISNRFFRAFGTFGQPNPFGGFMGMLTPIAVMMAFGYLQLSWKQWHTTRKFTLSSIYPLLFYTMSAGILSIGVVISWSRGAWLSFTVSLVVVIALIPRKWWQSALLIVFAGIFGVFLWTSGRLPATIVDRVNSATQEIFAFNDVRAVDITAANFAVVERLAHWQAAINMAEDYFWLGVGFGNYEVAYEDYRLLNWQEPLGHAHNYYLNVFAETGMIGLIGFITLWTAIIWLTWRTRHHPDLIARSVAIGMLGTWTYISMHSLTDNLYVNNMFLHLGIMFGVLAVLHRQTWQHKKP